MGQIIHQAVTEQGTLAVAQYALLFPLVVAGVLAGWRAICNVLSRTSA